MTNERIDGLVVYRRIRGAPHTRLLSVVVFTSSLAEVDIIANHREGANTHVHKPAIFAKFAEVVKTSGMFRRCINDSPLRLDAP